MRNRVNGVAGIVPRKVRFLQAQAQGEPGHQATAEGSKRGHVFKDDLAKAMRSFRKQIGAVQRRTGQYSGVVRRQFRAEIDSLLLVGLAGREFVAYAEIAPPGSPSPSHPDLHLGLRVEREEVAAEIAEASLKAF